MLCKLLHFYCFFKFREGELIKESESHIVVRLFGFVLLLLLFLFRCEGKFKDLKLDICLLCFHNMYMIVASTMLIYRMTMQHYNCQYNTGYALRDYFSNGFRVANLKPPLFNNNNSYVGYITKQVDIKR